MNTEEKQDFVAGWFEAENLITLIEPTIIPEKQFPRPDEASPKEILLLLQFLRVMIKDLLLDKEATKRENLTLSKLIEKQGV